MTDREMILGRLNDIAEINKKINSITNEYAFKLKSTPKIVNISLNDINNLTNNLKKDIHEIRSYYMNKELPRIVIRSVKPSKIMNLVKKEFKIDFTEKTKKFQFKEARHIAAYLLRFFTPLPLKDIAMYVGVTDHTTVIHSIKRVKTLMEIDSDYKDKIIELEEIIKINPKKNDNNIREVL